jgi:flagellar motor switch protein FliN/FliY
VDETEQTDKSTAVEEASSQDPAAQINAPAGETQVHPAEFPEATARRSGMRASLERFSDVQVEISVEIGRVTMSLGDMLQLGPGSVVELDREITEPVMITAQGVRIASGEVVVINDRFAVRITEVSSTDEDGGTR